MGLPVDPMPGDENNRLPADVTQEDLHRIQLAEMWEGGACAMLRQMRDDGKLTNDEYLSYLQKNYL